MFMSAAFQSNCQVMLVGMQVAACSGDDIPLPQLTSHPSLQAWTPVIRQPREAHVSYAAQNST